MSGVTTAMTAQARSDLPQALHCFNATVTPTGNLTNGSTAIASLSSSTNLVHGMPVSGTGIPANTFILNNAGTWLLSQAATATNAGVTLTCSGDVPKFALIKPSPAGTYGVGSVNYSDITGNSDESSGTGYTGGGFAWTAAQNITPANNGSVAFWSPSVNPSWTGATISTIGGMYYNSSNRGPGANRAISVHSFGGTQTVTSGTLTVILPANGAGTSILQIN